MKKIIYGIAIAVASTLSLAGCSTIPIVPSTDPHSHVVPYAVSLGERHFHAAMQYDPSQGEIDIRFYDANEKPYRTFNASKARAVLIVEGEPEREFYFSNAIGGRHTFPSSRYHTGMNLCIRIQELSCVTECKAETWFARMLSVSEVKWCRQIKDKKHTWYLAGIKHLMGDY